MAVLLAAIAIMGVMWAMAMPVWKQSVQREKESELIFRAGQYARAVALYQRKYANAFPPNVDVLLREKFLRKKYKDPITSGDFRLLSPVELQTIPGMTTTTPGFPGRPGGAPPSPRGTTSPPSAFGAAPADPAATPGIRTPTSTLGPNGPNVGPTAGIAAVVSRSSAQSIRIFKNRRQYNQWIVTVEDVSPRRGLGTPQPNQGQPNQPGSQPGGGFGSPRPGMSPGATGFPSRTP
jgi:type II secretory pathway pseudopilin PulG